MARRGKRVYSIQRYKNCERAVSLLDKVHNFVAIDIVLAAAVVTNTITKLQLMVFYTIFCYYFTEIRAGFSIKIVSHGEIKLCKPRFYARTHTTPHHTTAYSIKSCLCISLIDSLKISRVRFSPFLFYHRHPALFSTVL